MRLTGFTFRTTFTVAVSFVAFSASPEAGQNSEGEARSSAESVVGKHFAARDKLKSGQFSATGTIIDTSVAVRPVDVLVDLFCAFDWNAGSFRFDRLHTPRSGIEVDPNNTATIIRGGQRSVTPDAVTYHQHGQSFITIRKPPRQALSWNRPFDIRIAGTAHSHGFNVNTSFEKIRAAYESVPFKSAVAEANGIVRVEWIVNSPQSGRPSFIRSISFDRSKGNWPVQFQFRIFKKFAPVSPDRPDGIVWSEVRESQTIELTEVDKVWVPKTLTRVGNGGLTTHKLKLKWQSVNKPLERKVFTHEGFPLKGISRVIDKRTGRSVTVREFNKE